MNKQELAAKIWATANALRKNIKASEYKDYILGFMFYKYLSDKEVDFVKGQGGTEEDLKSDAADVVQYFQDNLGYFIKYDNLFTTWKKMDKKLGAQTVSTAIEAFYANLNENYARCFYVYNKEVDKHSGVFDALDAGLSKLGENAGSRDKAVRDIVQLVDKIPAKSEEYDVLGYIYEYLIKQFSSEAKKDGSFYTPAEVSRLMSMIIASRIKGRETVKVYDPCIGTAGLLMTIGKEVGKYTDPNNIKYYGQDLITETSNLAKMNLFMQDIPVQNITVRNANTLEEDWPYFDENTEYSPLFVDAVSCNPPYSAHWTPSTYQNDERFRNYGLAPETKADLAFLLHCLYHVKPNGIMAIVLPHGVLFRGGSELEIRKNLIENHNIETIIGMPAGMFFATGIPVIIMILSKNRPSGDVFFIDASKSFQKVGKQNVLRDSDVMRIYDAVMARKDIPHFAKLVSQERIVSEDYNLNIPRYVSAAEEEMPYDPYSVMSGHIDNAEIDQFNMLWEKFPALRSKIFSPAEEGYSTFACEEIKKTVFDDADVKAYGSAYTAEADAFGAYLKDMLINPDANPSVHDQITKKLFAEFVNDGIVDSYDVYQAFSSHWNGIESDLIRIQTHGKAICRQLEDIKETKKNKKTGEEVEAVKGHRGTIIPLDLIKSMFFSDDFKKMNTLKQKAEESASEYASILEELDEDVKNAVTKEDDDSAYDSKKLKQAIKQGGFEADVVAQLKSADKAMTEEKVCSKEIKSIDQELEEKAKKKIKELTDDEIDSLLIEKWIKPTISDMQKVEHDSLAALISNLEALHKKYTNPMSELTAQENETTEELEKMLNDLTGSVADMTAIKLFKEELQ